MSNGVLLSWVAVAACAAAIVVAVVDGRRAVPVAALAAAVVLAPVVVLTSDQSAALVYLAGGVLPTLAYAPTVVVTRRVRWRPGLDATSPLFVRPSALFGSRARRIAGVLFLLPAASWVSLNIPAANVATVAGTLFPVAYIGSSAVLRIFVAQTLEDFLVGVASFCVAASGYWLIRFGSSELPMVIGVELLAGAAAVTSAWAQGRHAPREAAEVAA